MILVPDHYKKFRCIADKCRDSCCIGWEIDVDCHTLKKYRDAGDEKILAHIVTDAEIPYIRLLADEKCPFLDERGLCRIISKYGDDYIPEICKRHPRYYNKILDFTECGLGLSCPTAAELILSVDKKPKNERIPTSDTNEQENEREIPTSEKEMIKTLYDLRDRLFELAFDDRVDIVDVVSGVLQYNTPISDYLFDGSPIGDISLGDGSELHKLFRLLPDAIARVELLSEELRAPVARAASGDIIGLLRSREKEARDLLYYFLHRYFLAGAESFDLEDRLPLCVLLLFIALAFIGDGDAVFGAVAFSKNIEYSTENIEILLEIIAEGA